MGNNGVSDWLFEHWGISVHVQHNILYSILAFVIIIILRRLTISLFLKSNEDVKERYYYTNAIKYTYSVILIVALVTIWFSEFRSIATIL